MTTNTLTNLEKICVCQCHSPKVSGLISRYPVGDTRKITICTHCRNDEMFYHNDKKNDPNTNYDVLL